MYNFQFKFASDPICDAVLKALRGSVTIGGEAVPVFNPAILSSDARQTGVSLSGVEETELVLVCFHSTGIPSVEE